MLPAILTTFFFALSGVTGQRTAVRLGSLWGNFLRLLLAVSVLGIVVAVFFPDTIRKEPLLWFLFSGAIGFGLGDIALYLAYERIGSRLTILLNLCLAPLFAMSIEWMWLGNAMTSRTVLAAAVILSGVVLAIRPKAGFRQKMESHGHYGFGIAAAVVAGFGQGTGAVISRKADAVARLSGLEINGISAAFQRGFAGLLVVGIVVLIIRLWGPQEMTSRWRSPFKNKVFPWLLGAALFGPVIGVSCFQWALQTKESGIVLAVTAMTPIVMMPLAAITEGDHPRKLAILGALVAVSGVILLHLWA